MDLEKSLTDKQPGDRALEFVLLDGTKCSVEPRDVEDFIFENINKLQEFQHPRMGPQRNQ